VTAPPDDAAWPADATPDDLPVPVHGPAADNNSALLAADAPVGGAPVAMQTWFDAIAAAAKPENDGSLAAAHSSARAYRSRAKADNTRTAGLPSPTDSAEVSETMAGIRRDAPNPQKKPAATLSVLRELLAPIPDDLRGLRDRALLLVGFAGALRRSELAAILLGDLERTNQGYELTLKHSKGSQTEAVLVPLPYRKTELWPVRALARWLDAPRSPRDRCSAASGCRPKPRRMPPALPAIGTEPLTPRSIARVVQARAAAGFAPREFAGHSLKRGALSTGMTAGAHAAQLKRLGRHKTFDVLGEYLEFGNLFDGHPLGELL
jgi:integrase